MDIATTDGSSTPRKPPGGGGALHAARRRAVDSVDFAVDENLYCGMTASSSNRSASDTLSVGDFTALPAPMPTPDSASSSFSLSQLHLEDHAPPMIATVHHEASPSVSSMVSTDASAGSANYPDSHFASINPPGAEIVQVAPELKHAGNDMIHGNAELELLRQQLLEAQAKVAHLNVELAISRSNVGNDSGSHQSDSSTSSPATGFCLPALGQSTAQPENAFRINNGPERSWVDASAVAGADVERGNLDSNDAGDATAPASFETGIIGQTAGWGHHRAAFPGVYPNGPFPIHSGRAFRPEALRGDSDGQASAGARFSQPWGNAAAVYGFESSQSSRSMTPAAAFGSLAPSLAASSSSLPGLAHNAGLMNYRVQAFSKLSPTAAEFTGQASAGFDRPSPWNFQPREESHQSYMVNADPPNYRRLLERSMSCNWKYIVDKIVCNNDQQASIFLQQKLKAGTNEQKFAIIQAILDQAYPLMINRFGNFLIQRCFEHGTPEQVVAIARAIRGNTLNLSMDAFGCHVVQKAFDCAPEEYKAIMVHELLRRIPETVIHRYACHVWQKLFELRWNGSPPQIMKYVNEALKGMWHEVALGETGSLVVQNIFENCLEEDKRPCVNEVLASIDVIAHGQFGNWCIQHICEHGSIPDRTRAVEHVLRFATEYSVDQFASKVVEKCLKIGGNDFLDRYLDRVCEARPDRPRMPLIDISGDQFGNYLIQYILTSADAHRREIVAAHVRRHMVSLRGSKYGSRVAMLCTNPAVATRPGPGAGHSMAVDRAPGGIGRGFSERGPWVTARGASYDRAF